MGSGPAMARLRGRARYKKVRHGRGDGSAATGASRPRPGLERNVTQGQMHRLRWPLRVCVPDPPLVLLGDLGQVIPSLCLGVTLTKIIKMTILSRIVVWVK